MDASPILKIQHLSLEREGQQILHDINLEIYHAQIQGLLGVNGSGKSSLAYALMGCSDYKVNEGHIWFDGQDITQLPIYQRARLGITMAWQEPVRFEGLPIGKYISLGMKKSDDDLVRAAIEAVNLSPQIYLRRSVDKTLSGGERKRVELAAVYAMRPRLAILDEPDSGIDALSLDRIKTLIHRLAEMGTAVLLITHRNEMAAIANEASIMCLGNIIFQGSILAAQTYYQSKCEHHATSLGPQPWR